MAKEYKYLVYLINDDPIEITEEQGLKLQSVLLDTNDKFIQINNTTIAVNQIRKVEPYIKETPTAFLPEGKLTDEQRQKNLEKIKELKAKLQLKNIID